MTGPTDRLLTIDEAVALVLERAEPKAPVWMPLPWASSLVLTEPIVADIDLPPFDKATMDGYAVRSSDLAAPGEHRLRVVASILAGQTSDRLIGPGEAAQIMTGAPLPPGADAVVNVERTRVEPDHPDHVVLTLAGAVAPGQFVMPRGREMSRGDRLIEPGAAVRPAMIGLIASVGGKAVRVVPRPRVVVVPTGDELVPLSKTPGPGQIRNSNGPMLAALVDQWINPHRGSEQTTERDPVGDRFEALVDELRPEIASQDLMILSGGVSAGTKDLVPAALRELGVEPVFHKVAVKPGKPIWFGVGPPRTNEAGVVRPGTLVFGLPGNPASCVVGFLLFVRPALDALAGRGKRPAVIEPGRLGADFRHKGDRPTFHPARWVDGVVTPLPWAGSADLRTVALADGFAAFPAGDRDHKLGDPIGFLRL